MLKIASLIPLSSKLTALEKEVLYDLVINLLVSNEITSNNWIIQNAGLTD